MVQIESGKLKNDVLLTVSGLIDPDIEKQISGGSRPEADYLAMASAFGADLMDYGQARQCTGIFGKILEKIGGVNFLLAWACFQNRDKYRVIFTDGEQVGIPLSIYLKFFNFGTRPRHLMIAHILSVNKKTLLFDWLGLESQIDTFFVYSSWQKDYIEDRWRVPSERVVFTPFMVDTKFFTPAAARNGDPLGLNLNGRPMICSVGLEFRDYPTFIEAVRDVDVQAIIAAASPWSKRSDATKGYDIPSNVLVRRFSQYELRDLYSKCEFIVLPLQNVNFQVGVTAILEAMAMEKPVICSRIPGQTDVIIEGENGLYVHPEDPVAMRQAIMEMLNNPETTTRLGKNGRQLVTQKMNLDNYVNYLSQVVAGI